MVLELIVEDTVVILIGGQNEVMLYCQYNIIMINLVLIIELKNRNQGNRNGYTHKETNKYLKESMR